MDSKIKILVTELSQDAFQPILLEKFSYKVNDKIIITLSNMLAIYFISDDSLKDKFTSQSFILICIDRLKVYLRKKEFKDYNFNQALELFTVAITEPKPYSDEIHNRDQALKYNEVEDNAPLKSNLPSFIGSTLLIGFSMFLTASFLGPLALLINLPIAYFSMQLGAKAGDKVEELTKIADKQLIYDLEDKNLNEFYILINEKMKDIKVNNLSKDSNSLKILENIKENDIENIIKALANAQGIKDNNSNNNPTIKRTTYRGGRKI